MMYKKGFRCISCLVLALMLVMGCKQGEAKKTNKEEAALPQQKVKSVSLFDKSLPEIKKFVNGKWTLVSGQNETMFFEFDDTWIEFKGDKYSWTDEDGTENGKLNWRQGPSGNGYDVFFMDVFYEENPTYPLAIKNDTLMIQDISENRYLYKLVRK